MTEIWNLSTLCRCCHSDGCFKKLNLPYESENSVEIYETMLVEVLGIKVLQPTVEQASNMICDYCIKRLQDASQFKRQVLACEQKFKVYCINELFPNGGVPFETVKLEIEPHDVENYDVNMEDDDHRDDELQKEDGLEDSPPMKEEITIKVDLKFPIKAPRGTVKDDVKKEGEPINNQETTLTVKKQRKKLKSEKLVGSTARRKRRTSCETYILEVETENGINYSCKNCKNTYKLKKHIVKHIIHQHRLRCKCEQCGKPFKDEKLLEKHVKTHHGKIYSCRLCDKKFESKYRLSAHEKRHTNQKVYQCDICKKVLRYKNTLSKHMILHSENNKALLCDICGWAFTQRCNLEAHIKAVHLKMRPYSCSICGKTYTAQKHVKGHMKTAHSDNPKPYQCEQCSKCFACPKSFKIHKLTHENHFACRYCSIVFNNKRDLEIHTKSHMKEQLLSSPYSCHLCGKALMSKFTLNRHLEAHSGIRRFSCDVCGLKFTQKCLMQRHKLRKHDPNRKIEKVKCDLCKKFVSDIAKHRNIHDTDKRKFFCDICGKNYPTNHALTRHKDQKHFGVTYDCDICGKKYIKKGSLKTHKLKVHRAKKEFESVASGQNVFDSIGGR